jgi:hypothetical protein
MILKSLHNVLTTLLHLERRFEPFFRPAANALFREPVAALTQLAINMTRPDERLALAQERIYDWEEAGCQGMIDEIRVHLAQDFAPGQVERGGNTKTHGIVRGTLEIRDDVPANCRIGLFAKPRSFPAWVRFSGPGPHIEPDINDVGFGSISIKAMGVPGDKLMDDEKWTQDFTAVCTPTFVTQNTRDNARLQYWSRREMPVWYFLDPRASHVRDFIMQSLWNETQRNPLGQTYYSCVPYLLGEGQAMKYEIRPRQKVDMRVPGAPFHPDDNYLRLNMQRTLDAQPVEFDVFLQLQRNPHKQPIENAGVRWNYRDTPLIPAAILKIPAQHFNKQSQFDFARRLTWNPWHSLIEHRPLGNQSRARQRMYHELAQYRQAMNNVAHYEPDGSETFE